MNTDRRIVLQRRGGLRALVALVLALAALAAVSPAAAQSSPRAFQAVCEAQGGVFVPGLYLGDICVETGTVRFTARERETQQAVCERAQGGTFTRYGNFTACLV
jgi:hypothetical protein